MLVLPFIINTTSTWAISLCGRHLGNARSLFYFDRIAPHIPYRARRHIHAQPGKLILGHRYRRGAAHFRSNTHTRAHAYRREWLSGVGHLVRQTVKVANTRAGSTGLRLIVLLLLLLLPLPASLPANGGRAKLIKFV